ncbi:MAG: hypothetical protein U1F39_04710 [Steroidobacteraceae bacterium]
MASAEMGERRTVKVLPDITLKELLIAFRDVALRAEMFAHHHINREPLSVRARRATSCRRCIRKLSPSSRSRSTPRKGAWAWRSPSWPCSTAARGLLEIARSASAPIHVRAVDPARARVIEGSASEVEQADARLLEQPELEESDDEEPQE